MLVPDPESMNPNDSSTLLETHSPVYYANKFWFCSKSWNYSSFLDMTSRLKWFSQIDGFTGKIIFFNVCQKRFWIGHAILLRICIQLDPKILIHVLNDPKNLYKFFAHEYKKIRKLYADSKSVEKKLEKGLSEKVICQVRGIEEEKLRFCKLVSPITFLLAK
jgi:hypothetical protein